VDGRGLLPEFDQEMAGARRVLGRVPFDQGGFRPHPRSWTMLQLATHLANLPVWVPMTLESEELDLGTPIPSPALPEGREELLDRFDGNVVRARTALDGADAQDLLRPWTLRNGAEVVFTLPRIAVVRSMVLNHMIHHRGQLTVYLRMTGAPVPGLYGASADERAEG
jgi:uncharacterized damage-inducible protein DinB